jgi:CheY-like chemotaxis protein
LVVEDNPDVRDMMKMLFELEGHGVSVAGDGISALALVESNPPDIAFLDIGLPELNGYEVAKRIRKKHPSEELLLVALTGYGQPKDRKRARDSGFDDHLTKPINMQRIREILSLVAAESPS